MVTNTNKDEKELQRSFLLDSHQLSPKQQAHQPSMPTTKQKSNEEEDLDTKVRKIVKTVMNADSKTSTTMSKSQSAKREQDLHSVGMAYPTPAPINRHTTKSNLASALALDLGKMDEKLNTRVDKDDSDNEEDVFPLSKKEGLSGREIGRLERVPTTPLFDLVPTSRPRYTLQQLLLPGSATANTEKKDAKTKAKYFNGNLEESYARLNDNDEEDATTQTTPVLPLNHHHHKMPTIAVSESRNQMEKEISLGNIQETDEDDSDDRLFEPIEVTNHMRGSMKNDDILDSISLKNILEQRRIENTDGVPSQDRDGIQRKPDEIADTLKVAKQFENIEFHTELTSVNGESRGPDEFAFSTQRPPTTPSGGTTRTPETDREGPNMVDITEIKMHRRIKPISQKDVSLDDFFNATASGVVTSRKIQKKDSIVKMKTKLDRKDSMPIEKRGNIIKRPSLGLLKSSLASFSLNYYYGNNSQVVITDFQIRF